MNISPVSQYFTTLYLVCIVVSSETKFKPLLYDVLSFTFHYDQTPSTKKIYQQGIDIGCQAFIISDDVFGSFLENFHELHDTSIQVFPKKHVLVYSDVLHSKPLNFDKIFRNPAIDDLPNILFMEYNENTQIFNFKTTKFVGPNAHSSDLQDILTLDLNYVEDFKDLLETTNLFPTKVKNLKGREIGLAIFNYMPYTIWKEVNETGVEPNAYEISKKTPLLIDGTEGWVFIQFCKRVNCTLLISLDEAGEWGEIFDNRTGNGIIGAVVERRAEVGVGALYSWFHESIFLSLSKFISRTGVTVITPKPKLRDPIGTPLLPFQFSLWIAVIVSFFVLLVCDKLLRIGYIKINDANKDHIIVSFSKIGINILGIYVLQSVQFKSIKTGMLIFFTTVLILGLLLGNSYSSSLASVLTIPQYKKAIDTVEELAASGMEWGSTHDAWIFSILLATQPMILQLLSKFRTLSKESLEQRAINEDLSFSIERLPYGHYAIGEYITERTVNNYQTLKNDIYYEMCVAMSTKTWPLMSELDDLILQIFESGVQKYVELDVVLKNTNNKIQLAVERSRHRDAPGPTNLTPLHLSGAFILLGVGLIISTISFLAEIIHKHKNKNKILRLQ
ncbi:probable glutamate receptor [Chironomus tepperi]|uniref:probable glutamate receptor n=1 Tax=Chironomus tepperi TaxID=113505 RepID=UPI00391FC0A8